LAGLAPAGLDLGNAEQPVALFAVELGAVPFEQIVGGTADAGGGVEQVQALLAALLLIAEDPAQADEREEYEGEELKDVGDVAGGDVDCRAGVYAEQKYEQAEEKCEQQDLRHFGGEEGLTPDPIESLGGGVAIDGQARGGSKGNEDYQRGSHQGAGDLAAQMRAKGVATIGEEQGDEDGEQAEAGERREAQAGAAAIGAAPEIGAEPEGVEGEADGEIGHDGERMQAAKVGGAGAAAMVEMPELGLPGARPVFALLCGDKASDGTEKPAIEAGQRERAAHERFSDTRRASSG